MLGYSYIRYKELRKLITLSWWKRYLYQKQLVLSWCKSGSWLQENCAVWHSEEVLEILTISQVYMCFLKSRGKIIKKKKFVVVSVSFDADSGAYIFQCQGITEVWMKTWLFRWLILKFQVGKPAVGKSSLSCKDVSLTQRDVFKSTNTILHLLTFNCTFSPPA